tara:strand:+ start:816 stop:1436 length:621 start_codon:yes stop_codon:yes gene_type:complete
MTIEIKISIKPVEYFKAINILEKRVNDVHNKTSKELIWILEHPYVFTAGKNYKKNEILDKKTKILQTNRGGKITWHGPGQLICYFVIDLNKRKKDIRKFVQLIENVIIKSLEEYDISTFSDRKNIGIWVNHKKKIKKIAAIGIRVSKWIAYHGFSLNINNKLNSYKKIIPCGISDRGVTNLEKIKKQNYSNIKKKIINNFIKYLKT